MVAHSVVESYRSVVRGAPFKSGEVSTGTSVAGSEYPQATEVRSQASVETRRN